MGIIRPTNDAIWYYYWSLVVDMFRIEEQSEHKQFGEDGDEDDENDSFLVGKFT